LTKGKKIHIIDDEVAVRRVVEIKLRNRGYDIIMAENGEEGLNLIKSQEPDVVISDINMPKIDGEALCKMINPSKKSRSFLTIIMTSRISADEQAWLSKMDETIFMEKPFSPSKLQECIDQYFRSQK
jgi:two-component system, chemotaxis family, chemotaxis protein CheY